MTAVYQLIPGVQSYEWGILGSEKNNAVANYAEATPALNFQRDDATPYAELWMGTHPTLPSYVIAKEPHEALSSVISAQPSLLGESVVKKYGAHNERCALPFLFKVLGIAKALSIQAHPNKQLAEKLHTEKPNLYKDDNHKPEMAIAIQHFTGFCGFRPVHEIANFLATVPELASVVHVDGALRELLQDAASRQASAWRGTDTAGAKDTVHDALQRVFALLMRADAQVYEHAVAELAQRYTDALQHNASIEVSRATAELVVRLNKQYPRDVGVLCTFFLNVVHLEPGEALYLGADEPHAYIDGTILECMAASDNVVRAGLTPKVRDVDVLVDMLTYQSARAAEQLLRPVKWDGEQGNATTELYDPPIDEFSVLLTTLGRSDVHSDQRAIQGPSIVLIVHGSGSLHAQNKDTDVKAGAVFFVGADTPIRFATKNDMKVARAFLEIV